MPMANSTIVTHTPTFVPTTSVTPDSIPPASVSTSFVPFTSVTPASTPSSSSVPAIDCDATETVTVKQLQAMKDFGLFITDKLGRDNFLNCITYLCAEESTVDF